MPAILNAIENKKHLPEQLLVTSLQSTTPPEFIFHSLCPDTCILKLAHHLHPVDPCGSLAPSSVNFLGTYRLAAPQEAHAADGGKCKENASPCSAAVAFCIRVILERTHHRAILNPQMAFISKQVDLVAPIQLLYWTFSP